MRIKTVFKIMIAFSALLSTGLVQAAFLGNGLRAGIGIKIRFVKGAKSPNQALGRLYLSEHRRNRLRPTDKNWRKNSMPP